MRRLEGSIMERKVRQDWIGLGNATELELLGLHFFRYWNLNRSQFQSGIPNQVQCWNGLQT